jgi:hypothetical protein
MVDPLTKKPLTKKQLTEARAKAGWVVEWIDKQPVWRDRPIATIQRRDVIERLDQIKSNDGKYAARHALNAVRRLFSWAVEGERFGLQVSPADRVRDRTLGITNKDLRRQRVLNDAELREVWNAASAAGYPFGPLVKLLMLTGQRLTEISHDTRGSALPEGNGNNRRTA